MYKPTPQERLNIYLFWIVALLLAFTIPVFQFEPIAWAIIFTVISFIPPEEDED